MYRLKEKKSQIFVALVANIIGICWGTTMGWTSPVLANLISKNYRINSPLDYVPSSDEQSNIGCMLPIGAFFSAFLAAPLLTKIGRKFTMLISSLFFIISYTILIATRGISGIYLARLFQGLGNGMVMILLPIYVGEISSPECRGILTSFIHISSVIGIFYVYCLGPFLDYITFQVLCLILPILFLILFAFMPETPHYYITKGKRHRAYKSLKFLRSDANIYNEYHEIENFVEESIKQKTKFKDIFRDEGNRKALFIGVGLILLQSLIGADAVLFYGEIIFEKSNTGIDSAIATIIIGAVMIISSLITLIFVDKTGRKCLLLTSSIGMFFSICILAFYFLLDEQKIISNLNWIPIPSLISFITFYCIGYGTLPYTILGEMFAPEIKLIAVSMAISISWLGDFIVTKSFLPLEGILHIYGVFGLFAAFSFISFLFTKFCVIETKGLSLQEIQLKLRGIRSGYETI
ncbi:hypothetical protein PVAND_012854 [Polypedilum vanderplanki]|uniref:Facilitated trehalose transporter Tret1 n=1 Tax=Polypedilum vanderplanki TaxID=319348 RepID=A0A9J6CNP0_POLVA|nr:hypothetical protein PVAND_012854 [Polypedilum vanderplanki]